MLSGLLKVFCLCFTLSGLLLCLILGILVVELIYLIFFRRSATSVNMWLTDNTEDSRFCIRIAATATIVCFVIASLLVVIGGGINAL